MKKGISLFFGVSGIPVEERVRLISEAGFDCVMTSADRRFPNGPLGYQVKLLKEYGLQLSSLHMIYEYYTLPLFWQKGLKGDWLTRRLIRDVRLAKKYGFTCVVTHLYGTYSEVGEKRLRKVLKVCEKCNVPLAIENIDDPELFAQVFERIESPYMKFCYDSGHNNFVDKDCDYLKKYGDKLVALHLHDNDGVKDLHTLNKFGNIDWKKIGKGLAGCNEVNLDYELLLKHDHNFTAEEVLKETKKQADELEKIILSDIKESTK